MSLTHFIGSELIATLGLLVPERVLGPWRGRRPLDRRRRAKFVPALYEDHAHGHGELCLLLEGKCLFSLEQAGAILQAGDLVVLPADCPHAEAFVRVGEAYRLAWWSLHPEEPTLHITRYTRRKGFELDYRMSLAALPAEAQARLAELRKLVATPRPPAIDPLREALLTLALALYRRVLDGGEAQLDTRACLVRRAVEFVRAEADRPLALAEVARAVRVSPNYLTGLFRAETGTPLGRFIMAERVARAQERLRQPGASVKAVAIELGFADPFTFSRAFKRVTGKAPRVWQAQG